MKLQVILFLCNKSFILELRIYLFDSTLKASIWLFQDTKFFILLRIFGEHSYLAFTSKVNLCWNSIFGYYFHLFAMKIKLYKENRYSPEYSEINIVLSFFYFQKTVLKAILFNGGKKSFAAILGMNGQFSKTENSCNTGLLWIKDIFCITVNCDEVKWTLFNMPWKRKACNLQKYYLSSLLLIRPFSYPYFFKMWPSFYPSSLQLFGKSMASLQ